MCYILRIVSQVISLLEPKRSSIGNICCIRNGRIWIWPVTHCGAQWENEPSKRLVERDSTLRVVEFYFRGAVSVHRRLSSPHVFAGCGLVQMANIHVEHRTSLLITASGPLRILCLDDKIEFLCLEDRTYQPSNGFVFIDTYRIVGFDMVDGITDIDRFLELCYCPIRVLRARREEPPAERGVRK